MGLSILLNSIGKPRDFFFMWFIPMIFSELGIKTDKTLKILLIYFKIIICYQHKNISLKSNFFWRKIVFEKTCSFGIFGSLLLYGLKTTSFSHVQILYSVCCNKLFWLKYMYKIWSQWFWISCSWEIFLITYNSHTVKFTW